MQRSSEGKGNVRCNPLSKQKKTFLRWKSTLRSRENIVQHRTGRILEGIDLNRGSGKEKGSSALGSSLRQMIWFGNEPTAALCPIPKPCAQTEQICCGLLVTERDDVSFLALRVVPRLAGSNPATCGISAEASTITTWWLTVAQTRHGINKNNMLSVKPVAKIHNDPKRSIAHFHKGPARDILRFMGKGEVRFFRSSVTRIASAMIFHNYVNHIPRQLNGFASL